MIIEDGDKEYIYRVDTNTGELLNDWNVVYEVGPYEHKTDYKTREYDRVTSKAPYEARHSDEVRDYLKFMVDGRVPMVTINNCRKIFDMDSGESRIQRKNYTFTKPQYTTMNKIVENLTYRNILIGSVEEVAEKLGVKPNKLRETLKKVEHLCDVYTSRDGMMKGQFKIIIPPWYGFKYPYSQLGKAYNRTCENWMRGNKC